MLTLSIKAITSAIESETPLDAVTEDGSIRIVINRYEPFVATAIHAGHHLRPALEASACSVHWSANTKKIHSRTR